MKLLMRDMQAFPRTQKVTLSPKEDPVVFQIVNISASDVEQGEDFELKYLIKAYGVTEEGVSVALNIVDYTPFFMIKIHHKITPSFVQRLEEYVQSKLPYKLQGSFVGAKLLKKKEFWGFTNGALFYYVRLTFTNHAAFFAAERIFRKEVFIQGIHSQPVRYKLYESNIEPFLRFMHIKDIQPAGWLEVPAGKYQLNDDLLASKCQVDITCSWKNVQSISMDKIAPLVVASFDLECTSSHGDFPVARKDYKKVAYELLQLYNEEPFGNEELLHELAMIFLPEGNGKLSKVFPKEKQFLNADVFEEILLPRLKKNADDILNVLRGRLVFKKDAFVTTSKASKDEIMSSLTRKLGMYGENEWIGIFPRLEGDPIIQIGTTVHKYGETDCSFRHIITLGTCEPIEGVVVESCSTEAEMMMKWNELIQQLDPDVVTGYNIFGFDMSYLYDRSRELGIQDAFSQLGRLAGVKCPFVEKKLSSSALGDNLLKYYDMDGRVLIDIMKVVQRDHKLDSFKLDAVANHFLKMNKHDVSPNEIFALQKGSAADRKVIAEYCVQDCALCNRLMMKLEILANNIGMANVCNVPLAFIFMRGQGVKIFSLVAKFCRENDMMIPVVKKEFEPTPKPKADGDEDEEDGYEGAIVLPPKQGIYLDRPVNVWDYASLYPSSMIAENLSHDMLVIDPKYDNLPGVEYNVISYDIYSGTGDKKEKVGEKQCKFVQLPNNEKGVIPRILQKLLKARKDTRKKIEYQTVTCKDGNVYKGLISEEDGIVTIKTVEGMSNKVPKSDIVSMEETYNDFEKAVLDGLQLAYKVTANSLYGQIGARTSSIYLKDIAACTTATGRKMILMAKEYLEQKYRAEVVYGDTDSVFAILPSDLRGKDALLPSIKMAIEASDGFKPLLKAPHDLEYEKTFYPFILFSKKRYVGNLYEHDDKKFKQKSMGIVLKRRDNANIVKKVYGGCIDIILNQHNIKKSVQFLKGQLQDMVDGKCELEDLIITKSLKSDYKDPEKIAHKVLAERMGERDPGNKPQVNDRIPFVYIETPPAKKGEKILQGNRIEHPEYIRQKKIRPDYAFYITNQVMKPVQQLYALALEQLDGYKKPADYFTLWEKKLIKEKEGDMKKVKDKLADMREDIVKEILFDPFLNKLTNRKSGNREITDFFKIMH